MDFNFSSIKNNGFKILALGIGAIALFFAIKWIINYMKDFNAEKNARNITTSFTDSDFKVLQNKVFRKYGKPSNLKEVQYLAVKQFPNINSFSKFAENVYDAKSIKILPDHEDQALGVFSMLASKFEIAQFAKFFYNKYKRGLMTYINEFFNVEQLNYLNDIINKKPDIL